MSGPSGMALGPDGSLYYADSNSAIRKVTPAGIVLTVAGPPVRPWTWGCSSDGVIAAGALLGLMDPLGPSNIAVGQDGTVYFPEAKCNRVRKVGPDGLLRTVAGNGTAGFGGDNGPATLAQLSSPVGVALAPDGSILIADKGNVRIRRVTSGGIISTVGGNGNTCRPENSYTCGGSGYNCVWSLTCSPSCVYNYACGIGLCGYLDSCVNDGAATQAPLMGPTGVTVVSDGTIIVADGDTLIRRFVSGGGINGFAGFDYPLNPTNQVNGCVGIDCPATRINLNNNFTENVIASGAAGDVLVSGAIYLDNWGNNSQVMYRLTSALSAQQIGLANIAVPSQDAGEVYIFDLYGRHLRTMDALTNAQTELFQYDSAGRLASVTDSDGNLTMIQRDAQGNPAAIVGPYGQHTTLTPGSDSYLQTVP